MLTPHECLKSRFEITAIEFLQSGELAFSTQHNGVKLFSYDSCNVTNNLSIEQLGYKTTAVTFSKEYKLFAIANSDVIYIINLDNKTVIQTIRTTDGAIEVLSFVPNSPYLIAGTNGGRVIKYRYDGRSQLSRLCSFPYLTTKRKVRITNNYVSALAFYGNYIASSGYGGAITLLKLNSLTNKMTINVAKARINVLCFLDSKRLISGGADGNIIIHPLKKHKMTKSITTPFTNITNILIMPNPQYIMVSGNSNKIIIIDVELAKIVSNNYLSFKEEIRHIALYQEKLVISLQNNELLKVELPTTKELRSCILKNSINEAFKLLERDPMLHGTKEHKRLEAIYENLYVQAINARMNSNTKELQKIVDIFKDIPSKKDDIESISTAFENYNRLKALYLEKKYALAYAICEKYPALKRTHQFKKMEESFKDAFTFAQKQILMKREDIAREVLSPFATVITKKPIIKLLLNQNKDFIDFVKAIQTKDHLLVDKLVKKYEIFSQIPTFTILQSSTQHSLEHIQELINQIKISEAIEEIKKLWNTPSIKDELTELYKSCKIVQELQKKYEANDFKSCYEIIDTNPNLDDLELTKMLEKHWTKIISQCEEFALKGDIKSIKETLKELLTVQTRLAKIGDLLRVSFHTKIKVLLAKRSFANAEVIIYSYVDVFGIDSEISFLMKGYEKMTNKKLAITLNQEKIISRDSWINSPLIINN